VSLRSPPDFGHYDAIEHDEKCHRHPDVEGPQLCLLKEIVEIEGFVLLPARSGHARSPFSPARTRHSLFGGQSDTFSSATLA